MDHISELTESLNGYFDWNKARMTCFVKMLLALIVTRATNLNKLACAFASNAQQSSRYRRLQRFFSNFTIDYDMIAGFIFKIFFVADGKWYLAVDRTNWQWGCELYLAGLRLSVQIKVITQAIQIIWKIVLRNITAKNFLVVTQRQD